MKKYAFGVDIGGTTVKMGFFDAEGALLEKWELKTDLTDNGANILPDIAASIKAKVAETGATMEDVIGVGMGVPGPVNEDGVVLKCINLGWGVFNIEEEMSKLTGVPCKAGNDANVATLGEMYKGGGAGYDDLVMLTFGTGVGGGIIHDGKMISGVNGAAGEIGHMPMNPMETEPCNCGNCGCLEQYASATGLANVTKRILAAFDVNTSLRYYEPLTAKEIFDAYKEGDPLAKSMVEDWGSMVGKACATIGIVVNPDVFVLGGGMSKAGQVMIDVVEKYYNQYVFHAARGTKFVLATLGNDAGIYGGVKLALDAAKDICTC
ncbi:MAG: ROK family glucokinase [Eubacterium sp.]|nr:ROK family glucokinase [Eubacterium sp.]